MNAFYPVSLEAGSHLLPILSKVLVPAVVLECGHPHIFTHLRPHPLGKVICVYNFSELPQTLPADFCYYQRVLSPYDLITRRSVQAWYKLVHLAPYDRLWIVEASSQQ